MKEPWTILFWFQLRQWPAVNVKNRLIATYDVITVSLTTKDQIITISDGNKTYSGPRITGLDDKPWIFFGLTRDIASISLYLNGERVIEVARECIIFKVDDFHAPSGDGSANKTIEQDLSSWIEKRESMFKLKCETSNSYVLLSPIDQEDQLRNRIRALEDLLVAFHGGKMYFFDDILANLRSLVFHKDKSKSYDPLLLRVAAFKKMALPVYVIPNQDELINCVAPGMENHLVIAAIFSASFESKIPCVKMIDFQEYLESPALRYSGELVSPLLLIETAATTQSSAHFDQRVPHVIEGLKNTPVVFGYNTMQHYIVGWAELAVKVGHFILGKT